MVTAAGERKELLQERTLLANGWRAGREHQIYVNCFQPTRLTATVARSEKDGSSSCVASSRPGELKFRVSGSTCNSNGSR